MTKLKDATGRGHCYRRFVVECLSLKRLSEFQQA